MTSAGGQKRQDEPAAAGTTVDEGLITLSEAFDEVKQELKFWFDSLHQEQRDDPVFEGIVRDFLHLNQTIAVCQRAVNRFVDSTEEFCHGIEGVSSAFQNTMGGQSCEDKLIISDVVKYRKATSAVTRGDAPHSALAKMRRDLNFNVAEPLRLHVAQYEELKDMLATRRRRYTEMQFARQEVTSLRGSHMGLPGRDRRIDDAEKRASAAERQFLEVDRPIFEWLLILEEYKHDIYDSLLQTMKYLQYEFLASSAHALRGVLPKQMEFRPLVEMTPQQLEPLVKMEIAEDDSNYMDATSRLLAKWEKSGSYPAVKAEAQPVNPLSLMTLRAQGIDETQATRALRLYDNDAQAALDWIIAGCPHMDKQAEEAEAERRRQVEESVRMPTTLKWVDKLRESRQREKEAVSAAACQEKDVGKRKETKFIDGTEVPRRKRSSSSSVASRSSCISSSSLSSSAERRRQRRQRRRERDRRRREKRKQAAAGRNKVSHDLLDVEASTEEHPTVTVENKGGNASAKEERASPWPELLIVEELPSTHPEPASRTSSSSSLSSASMERDCQPAKSVSWRETHSGSCSSREEGHCVGGAPVLSFPLQQEARLERPHQHLSSSSSSGLEEEQDLRGNDQQESPQVVDLLRIEEAIALAVEDDSRFDFFSAPIVDEPKETTNNSPVVDLLSAPSSTVFIEDDGLV